MRSRTQFIERFELIVTSYGRNRNLDDKIKNQEKANKSLSYRFAAINQKPMQKKIRELNSHINYDRTLKNQNHKNLKFDKNKKKLPHSGLKTAETDLFT